MSIKFSCECGREIKAPDGSEGRWVRCPQCRNKLPVPGAEPHGSTPRAGGVGFGTAAAQALELQDTRAKQQSAGEPRRWLSPAAEQWLMDNGLWIPGGVASMALALVIGSVGYATGVLALLPLCVFLFVVGLGTFLYGWLGGE